jgi:hypothetical protein
MRAFKVLRGVGVAACVAGSLSLVLASEAFAATGPRTDAFAQQATLIASDEIGHSLLGSAVALSSDGKTALIGGRGDNEEVGAAWVFTRKGSKWNEEAKLTGGGEIGSGQFGSSVALSSNGKTALIGGGADNEGVGAAWVFTRSGSTWTQQGEKLTPNDEVGGLFGGEFGSSVALSSDGSTALIGGPSDHFEPFTGGAAWVFTRARSRWTQQGAKLIAHTDFGEGPLDFGVRVSLSGDGNTALIGGEFCHHCDGRAWVFTRSGTTWGQQAELAGVRMPGIGSANLGDIALSSDGNTALIGLAEGIEAVGSAFVFARSGSNWAQQGPELLPNDAIGEDVFGSSVALSGDGNLALIGDSTDNEGVGAAWLFNRSGSTWTQQGEKLSGKGESGTGKFGSGVALSSDGNTALVGGPYDSEGVGAAWVFRRSGSK